MRISNMRTSLETDFFPGAFEVHSPPLKAVTCSVAKETRRILIVDDDPNTTHLVKILLERSGPSFVLEENDATEAYQTPRSFKPDLILLDVIMPGIDGGEVAEQIQADRALHDTPIIFQNGLVTKSEAKSGLHIQGHPVVAKPINIPELIEAIEERVRVHSDASVL